MLFRPGPDRSGRQWTRIALNSRTRNRINCALTAATGLTLAGVSLWDAIQRDPLDAPSRTLAAAGVLVGATIAYVGIIGHCAMARAVSRATAVSIVSAYSLTMTFAAGELAATLMDRSHSIGYSLAAKVWLKRHWQLNPYGYRDAPWTADRVKSRRVLAVIGDSLTAGHGIEDPAETYCARLGARLGPAYRALNLGVNAADTRSELARLKQLPVKPHAIVLQYFGNDIVEGARDAGFYPPRWVPYINVPAVLRPVVARSYLANYLYFSRPCRDVDSYWSFVKELHRRPALRARHAEDLRAFAAHARTLRVPLVVVVFPFLHDLGASELYVPWVREVFTGEGVPVLDVRPLVEAMPLQERVVNMNDVHPSVTVHRRVADALYRMIVESGIAR